MAEIELKEWTMNKTLAKTILHWLGFLACIAAAIYIGAIMKGLSVNERVALVCTTLGGLFVSLGKLLPTVDAAVDRLPVLLLLALPAEVSCHNVPADQFFDAVVDCAKVNPEASAAIAGVETCLLGAVAGNPASCLNGLITEAHFTVDEVACVVAWEAHRQNVAVAEGDATAVSKRDAASKWLASERIAIRNSYR